MANKKLLIALGISTAISLIGCNNAEIKEIKEFNASYEQVTHVYGPAPVDIEEIENTTESETEAEIESMTKTESTVGNEEGHNNKLNIYNEKDENTLESEFSSEIDVLSSHVMYGVKQFD